MAKRDAGTEHKLEGFAEDLGKLLGTAKAKAEGWLGQCTQIAKTLVGIRDTTTKLLSDLGHEADALIRQGGRPRHSAVSEDQPQPVSKKKRRKMSAAARKKISEAQKKRWAAQKATR